MDTEIELPPPFCDCDEDTTSCIWRDDEMAISRIPHRVPTTWHRWNGVTVAQLEHAEAVNDTFLQGETLYGGSSLGRGKLDVPVRVERVKMEYVPTETELQITVLVLASIRAELRRRSDS